MSILPSYSLLNQISRFIQKQVTIEPIIKANVKEGTNVYTDEWYVYRDLHKKFNHQIVNHSAKDYEEWANDPAEWEVDEKEEWN